MKNPLSLYEQKPWIFHGCSIKRLVLFLLQIDTDFRLLVGWDPYERVLLGGMQYGAVCSVKLCGLCHIHNALHTVLYRAIAMLQRKY